MGEMVSPKYPEKDSFGNSIMEEKTLTLTPAQQIALSSMVTFAKGESDFGMMVLEGYAGTGKTTLIGELVRVLSGHIGRLAIAAPTNKAVRVLKGKIEMQAGVRIYQSKDWDDHLRKPVKHAMEYGSIHSFLGLRMEERDDGSEDCRQEGESILHEYDLVIVDECSMLSTDMMQRITLSRRGALVLFVGDPAQLPPVKDDLDVSAVFRYVTHRVTLTDVVRQAKDNPIIRLSIAIRKAIENNDKLSTAALAEVLPIDRPAKAGLMPGGREAAISALLLEREQKRDARIIAYTNPTVLAYNQAIHTAIHGWTPHPFVVGERVIAHKAFGAIALDDEGEPVGSEQILTSEELIIEELELRNHPRYGAKYSCCRAKLKRETGQIVICYVADDSREVDRDVERIFSQWRAAKAAYNQAKQHNSSDANRLHREASEFSGQAWELRKTFAPLRHAYAITAHKSQGSTFDTAIVDFNDLSMMRSSFLFNRALYVAATRASEHLAIVI